MDSSIPRSEYPRPQFRRGEWMCLNGEWQFEVDHADTGRQRGLIERELNDRIVVPFCPESSLSGIGCTDFMNAVWYRRETALPASWAGKRLLLHFQAVDYDTTVWVNGREAGSHRGGFSSFTLDISALATAGSTAVIVVRVRDYDREHKAGGKQKLDQFRHDGCLYLRTTGIWQTVWLEPVPTAYLQRARITPELSSNSFRIEQPVTGRQDGMSVRAVLKDGRGEVSRAEIPADADFVPALTLPVPADRRRLWSPEDPFLYDLELTLLDRNGQVVDRVESYAGLRAAVLRGRRFLINGRPIFQRLVLDQGYYADGLMTAPSEQALIDDITLSQAAGFNGARLHQKVFEERFLYHADRLGYLVWGEFGDWGVHRNYGDFRPIDGWRHQPHLAALKQWQEVLRRDYSHPAIIGWCPLNETHRTCSDDLDALDDLTQAMFLAAKATDATRPVLDSSGYSHRVMETDIYDSHNYTQDPAKFAAEMQGEGPDRPYVNQQFWGNTKMLQTPYDGQPYFCSEFGGIKWNPAENDSSASWGYGETPRTLEEFYARFEGLCHVLLDNPEMFGYCYTQLTDVFQEQNGIYGFDRKPKFAVERLHRIQRRTAACEKV